MEEGVKWLSYTYFYVRMYINPLCYGLNYKAVEVSFQKVRNEDIYRLHEVSLTNIDAGVELSLCQIVHQSVVMWTQLKSSRGKHLRM